MDNSHIWLHYVGSSCCFLLWYSSLPSSKRSIFLAFCFQERPLYNHNWCIIPHDAWFPRTILLPTNICSHTWDNDELASCLVLILNGASFFSRIVPGILADRLGRLDVLYAAGLSTRIFVLCRQRITTSASITVLAAPYGFFSGAILSLMLFSLASAHNDPRNIGTYLGMGMFIMSLTVLIGPLFNGLWSHIVEESASFQFLAVF